MKLITSLASPFLVILVELHTNQEIDWLLINLDIIGRINELEINDSFHLLKHVLNCAFMQSNDKIENTENKEFGKE